MNTTRIKLLPGSEKISQQPRERCTTCAVFNAEMSNCWDTFDREMLWSCVSLSMEDKKLVSQWSAIKEGNDEEFNTSFFSSTEGVIWMIRSFLNIVCKWRRCFNLATETDSFVRHGRILFERFWLTFRKPIISLGLNNSWKVSERPGMRSKCSKTDSFIFLLLILLYSSFVAFVFPVKTFCLRQVSFFVIVFVQCWLKKTH